MSRAGFEPMILLFEQSKTNATQTTRSLGPAALLGITSTQVIN